MIVFGDASTLSLKMTSFLVFNKVHVAPARTNKVRLLNSPCSLPITSTNRASRELGDLDHLAHNEKKIQRKDAIGLVPIAEVILCIWLLHSLLGIALILKFQLKIVGMHNFLIFEDRKIVGMQSEG
jgi:hypothetical protein